MEKLRRMVVLALLFISLGLSNLSADVPSCVNCQTAGMVNGRYWATLDWASKVFVLTGIMEGIKAASSSPFSTVQGVEGCGNSNGMDNLWCTTCTVGDLMTELDAFYQVAPNKGIPVAFALTACIKRFKGGTAAELDDYVTRLRRLFNND